MPLINEMIKINNPPDAPPIKSGAKDMYRNVKYKTKSTITIPAAAIFLRTDFMSKSSLLNINIFCASYSGI